MPKEKKLESEFKRTADSNKSGAASVFDPKIQSRKQNIMNYKKPAPAE